MSMRRMFTLLCGFTAAFGVLSSDARGGGGGPGQPCDLDHPCNPPISGEFGCAFVLCETPLGGGADICVIHAEDTFCNDGAPCNGIETCNPNQVAADGCVDGTPPCDDGVACTSNDCTDTGGGSFSCVNTPSDAFCSNGVFCDGLEICDPTTGCQPSSGNPCFPQACDEAGETCFECQANEDCDDGVFCNGLETCDTNPATHVCVAGTFPCNDTNNCTVDTCNEDPSGVSCTYTPDDSLCTEAGGDGNLCTPEKCDGTFATGGCFTDDPIDCTDAFACTQDLCDPTTGMCTHDPDPAYACGDGVACNGDEVCDPTALGADQTTGCTVGTPDDSICDDGLFCTGVETCGCLSGTCCAPTFCYTDPTNTPNCDLGGGVIVECFEVGCVVTTQPPTCNDNVECTTDSCNENTNSCDHVPVDSFCSDNLFCNGVETCVTRSCPDLVDCCIPFAGCFPDYSPDRCLGYGGLPFCGCDGAVTCCRPGQGCIAMASATACALGGGRPVCDDCSPILCCPDLPSVAGLNAGECSVGMTAQECADALMIPVCGGCYEVECCGLPPNIVAGPNGASRCERLPLSVCVLSGGFADCGGCQDGADPCPSPAGDLCSENCQGGRCVECFTNADCDDGNACNGLETCMDEVFAVAGSIICGACQNGTPVSCSDGFDCTIDTCVPTAGAPNQFTCSNVPSNAFCDDGLACNGTETCCVAPECTTLVVAGPGGGINLTGCVSGTPPNCDDVINCTLDACVECTTADCPENPLCTSEDCTRGYRCTSTPNDSMCGDTVDCTTNKCDPPASAFPHGCVFIPDDAFCDDGLFCNGNETCDPDCTVAGGCTGCVDGTPPNCNDGVQCTTESCNEVDHCVNTPRDAFCSDGIECNGADTCVGGRCPTPVLCCLPGKGCFTSPDISECENATTAGEPLVPLCYSDSCPTAICCYPTESDCTEDPVAPAACLGDGGIPICGACQSVVCCVTDGVFGCDPGVSPEACVDSGRTPACGDCLVRCCFPDTVVAGGVGQPGCIEDMPLDLCTFLHGHADCDGCEHAGPPDCDDNIDCTVDQCQECSEQDCTDNTCTPGQCKSGFRCTHTVDDSLCDDGVFCNGAERCLPDPIVAGFGLPSGCEPGEEPVCPKGIVCHPCVDGCATCASDADCIDSNPCTLDNCLEVTPGLYQCVNFSIPACTPPQLPTTQIAQKGSLLIFSKIELKWDNDGNLLQDTFLSLYNDDDANSVEVQAYFINGDVPLEEVCMGDPCVQIVQEFEPGWNTADCRFTLTKSNPIYWSAARGGGNLANGGGNCQPFSVLDDSFPPGRPDPENGMRTRILRGYVVMWAVALNECVLDEPNGQYQEIRWNDLTGEALIVNYERGYAWDYKPWAFQAHGVEHGEFTGTPGVLNLDGVEYDAVYSRLLLDFQATGSQGYLQVNRDGRPGLVVTSDTDLTLHPVSVDVRQDGDGPIVTKAEFSIYNEFESKFSGTKRCIQCWEQRLLSHYTEPGIPNHFRLSALGTDAGVARIEGVASVECNFLEPFFERSQAAPLLGVSAKVLTFGASPSTQEEWAGTNLFGVGAARAAIQYDLFSGSGELLRLAPSKADAPTSRGGAGR